ncbi:hypothetical protein [Parageobacillus thermoglucosidasius]|uniref:hypothetical protein n=1 Tax=Parageobacillus thermoglucosidasius TaxID=1426 RepID=UPI002430AD40|nr:hypothetical protein [Parageobacillus thermoglucosidasius]MBY6269933.1 hypothetical protein [Parageobacillus thermoglucosidasius]
MEVLIDFVNWLIAAFGAALGWLINLFPDSPFRGLKNDFPGGFDLGYVTWLIPFPTMLLHFGVFLAVLVIYYVVRVAARWLRVIRS